MPTALQSCQRLIGYTQEQEVKVRSIKPSQIALNLLCKDVDSWLTVSNDHWRILTFPFVVHCLTVCSQNQSSWVWLYVMSVLALLYVCVHGVSVCDCAAVSQPGRVSSSSWGHCLHTWALWWGALVCFSRVDFQCRSGAELLRSLTEQMDNYSHPGS